MQNTTIGVTLAANMDPSGVLNGVKAMQGAFNGLKLPANLTKDITQEFDKLTKNAAEYKKLMEKGVNTKSDFKAFEKLEKSIGTSIDKIVGSFNELNGKQIYLDVDATKIRETEQEINKLKADITNKLSNLKIDIGGPNGKISTSFDSLFSGIDKAISRSSTLKDMMASFRENLQIGNLNGAISQLDQLEKHAVTLKGSSANLLESFKQIGLISFSTPAKDLAQTKQGADLLKQGFDKIRASVAGASPEIKTLVNNLETLISKKTQLEEQGRINYQDTLSKGAQDAQRYAAEINKAAQANNQFVSSSLSATQQVQQLQQSTQYFFSLRNMINLLKRGIDEAVQSVKELDAAMTETAVVTDYKVSDLWGMLPQYTQLANQLGATTQGAYETMTLYFQQGLDQQAAFEIGAETMKMARIAGLDYAETTDMMTAALRGFNMELNETSAKRVNDVYSELAAITASDTEELGTAMQRTASIAHSAGMSFEGTTAFLAQAIETTREPAENIGTAMKTIVARFQEMKKNPLEISDVEGEEVSYNKIDTALKSIGVNLKDTNGQFRELDQVFLDISQRWDGLTQTQQRYIATTAAGSRQQSRFIAMMSNYERTMQLVDAANNSAGASDEQFSKTMDSLESKLNKLHNAWQQFTMGIANNSIIKTAVDGLTGFLNITNQIIDTLSLGSGTIKSFLSVFAAFTGLKMSGKLLNSLIGGLGGLIDPTSSFTQGLFGGATGIRSTRSAYSAAQIYKPIVDAINNQTNQLKPGANAGANINNPLNTSAGYKDYINARNNYRVQAQKGGTVGGAIEALKGLSAEQRLMVLHGNRGSQATLRRSLLAGLQNKGFSKESQKLGGLLYDNVMQGFADGKLTTTQAQEALHSRDLIKATREAGPEAGKAYADAIKTELANNEAAIYDQAAHYMETKGLDYKQALQLSKKEHIANWRNGLNTEDFASASTQAATKSEKLMNTMSGLGNTVMATGQAFTTLGSILSNLGLDTAGMLFTTLGSTISSVGMTISSVGSMLSTFGIKVAGVKGTFTALKAAIADAGLMPLLGGLGAGLLVGGAFVAIKTLVKKSEEKAKESAKKIQDTYTEATEETEKKISSLNDSKTRFEQLSKGVDEYGRNVSLTNEDYKEFLDLSRSIADVAPELISGYDAEGHAIIAQGDAIDQLIAKQKELKKQAQENYTTNTAFKDVLKGLYVSDAYKNVKSSGYSAQIHGLNTFDSEITGIRDALFKVGYNDMTAVNNALSKYLGRDIDLSSVTTEDIRAISEHYGDLIKAIESNNHNLSDSAKESLEQALGGLNESWDDLVSETAPLVDQLQQYLNLNKLDAIGLEIGDEFIVGFNKGLENIALDAVLKGETDVGKIKNAAKEYAQLFKDNVGPGSEFVKVLDDLDKAQKEYLDHLGETEAINKYEEATKSASDSIKELAESMRDGSAAGEAMYNVLINKANEIKNSINEPIMSIGEAINTLSDDIDEARGAYDEFSKLTKDKNYSTAAEGMKKIYDETMDAKHSGYDGDFTFWEGSRRLLDPKTAQGDVDTVRSAMESLAPLLEEGIAGYEAFYNRVTSLSQETRDNLTSQYGILFDEDGFLKYIPDTKEAWGALGKEFKMSEMMLTSMLNKAQQFADINFSNVSALKQALSEDDRVYHGTEGKQVVKQDLLVDEIRQQYPDWGDSEIYSYIDKLDKDIITIPSKMAADERGLTEKEVTNSLKTAGIKNMNDVLQKLGPTGTYNEDDLKYYAGLVDKEGVKDWDTAYKDFKDSLGEPIVETNNILQQIASDVATLAGKDTIDKIKEGKATSKDLEKVDKLVDDVYGEKGVNDTPFQKFMLGQDENGEPLSKNQYIDTRQAIQDARDTAKDTRDALLQGSLKALADGNEVESDALYKRYKQYDKLLKDLKTINDEGDKAFEEAEKKRKQQKEDSEDDEKSVSKGGKKKRKKSQEEKEETEEGKEGQSSKPKSKSKSSPSPYSQKEEQLYSRNNRKISEFISGLFQYSTKEDKPFGGGLVNKSGASPLEPFKIFGNTLSKLIPTLDKTLSKSELQFGNTNLKDRQVLDWSKEPINSQNYQNAATWGIPATDLQNSVSTFLSQAMTFGEGENQIALAFTPMLQTPDGTPQVLSADVVGQYLDTIVSQATDSTGQIDTQKLFQLDKQGLEIEGQEISNLLMGAFTGEGADEASGKLGEFVHNLEEIKMKAKDAASEVKRVAQEATKPQKKQPEPTTPTPAPAAPVKTTASTEEHTIQYHVQTDGEDSLTAVEEKGQSLADVASNPISFLINAIYPNLGTAIGLIQEAQTAASTGANLNVDSDISSAETAAQTLASYAKTYTAKFVASSSGLSGILGTLGSIISRINTINSMKVKPRKKGQNNYIPYRPVPTAGSAAQGTSTKGTKSRYGQVGPNNNGGLTLTGEEGFEIAWIPSENRSMILGVNGPQMLNLPSETVIWTHEQSKKILKQQSISAGSAAGSANISGARKYLGTSTIGSSSVSSGSASSSSGGDDNDKKSQKISHFSIYEIIRFDNDQYLAVLSSEISKRTKSIEKSLKKIGIQSKSIAATVQQQIVALQQQKKLYEDNLSAYKNQLKDILKEQELVTWTDANGESQERTFDLSAFIGQANGTYAIDYKAIQQTASSKEEQEAIFKAAESAIKNLTDGVIKMQDEIDKINEEIEKLGQQVSEAFYQWENELTRIYNLNQRISAESSAVDRTTAQVNLELSKLGAGLGSTATAISNISSALRKGHILTEQQIKDSQELMSELNSEMALLLSTRDEEALLNHFLTKEDTDGSKQANIEFAKDRLKATQLALSYIKDVVRDVDGVVRYNIDTEQLEKDHLSGDINTPTYEAIKKIFDNIEETNGKIQDAISSVTDTIQKSYEQLTEYKQTIADFEDKILKGLEDRIKQEIDNAKNLNDSLTNALKKLLDEVKRKLDERRKAEDNAKTEEDIAKKQQRLAILKANTAGGNQTEIAQLEKEIADAQQSYQRTLEDQLLEKLQQQGDAAAEQRERIITILEAQLEVSREELIAQVNEWLKNPEKYQEQIREVLRENEDYKNKGEDGRSLLDGQISSDLAKLGTAVNQSDFKNHFKSVEDGINTLVDLINSDTFKSAEEEITHKNINTLDTLPRTAKGAATGASWGADIGQLYAANFSKENILKSGAFSVKELLNSRVFTADELSQEYGDSEVWKGIKEIVNDLDATATSGPVITGASEILQQHRGIKQLGINKGQQDASVSSANNIVWHDGLGNIKSYYPESGKIYTTPFNETEFGKRAGIYSLGDGTYGGGKQTKDSYGNIWTEYYKALHYKNEKKYPKVYKTGGLASQTGPAWLDGTPAKPELVLNAQDTKNFIALKDVLSRVMGSISSMGDTTYRDMTYEININVDHINNDYDVDRIAERVKKNIVKDASYRNVTQVRNFR